jgi:predicted methyltransferase
VKHLTPIFALSAMVLTACGQPDAPASDTPAPALPPAETAAADVSSLDAAIAGAHRTEAEKARDAWRHPKETLEFFGVEADDKVVELWPGGGWYTNVIAPYLAGGGGTLVAAYFDPNIGDEERRARVTERLEEFKATYSDPKFGTLEYSAFSAESGPLTAPGTADVVLTFRNLHNWMNGGYTEKFFADAYAALKPGGVLGVVEHRLPSTQTQDPTGSSGYVHEDYVKSLAEAAGFEFAEASEINANPADTADHPFGVWTLPPNSRTQDRDGNIPEDFDPEAYAAIGESDRMTLKFIKPTE